MPIATVVKRTARGTLILSSLYLIFFTIDKMGRSRNWHALRSPISKIRNIQVVDTYVLTVHCEFQRVRITGVPLARCQTSKTQLEVRSLNVTWRRDLWCHRVIVFLKCVKLFAEQLWQIWRRYAPPFFAISLKSHLRLNYDVMRSMYVFAYNFWLDWARDMI